MNKIPFYSLESQIGNELDELQSQFQKIITKGRFILGQEVQSFEFEFSKYLKCHHTIAVSNGYDAIFLALTALNIGPGDEVITTSHTFIATILAIIRTGAKPVLVDINPNRYTITTDIETNINSNTKAVIAVHIYGQPAEIDPLITICNKHNLHFIEDYAQSHGATYDSKSTGTFGIVNCTSFYPTKNLGALGDSGAITTNNIGIFNTLQYLRNYGSNQKYVHETIGYNHRMDELQAAFLNIKLRYLELYNSQRRSLAKLYRNLLSEIEQITLPQSFDDSDSVYHQYVIQCDHRDKLQKYLLSNNIETLIHYPIPSHLQKCLNFLNYSIGDLPHTEKLAQKCLSLPIYPGLSQSNIQFVCDHIKYFINEQ